MPVPNRYLTHVGRTKNVNGENFNGNELHSNIARVFQL
jgi:hypothetical protein